jgi:hypothetical protein
VCKNCGRRWGAHYGRRCDSSPASTAWEQSAQTPEEAQQVADGRQSVIDEISDEIDSGDAHLITRNELAEFVEWLVTDENASLDLGNDLYEINSVVTDFMEWGEFREMSKTFAKDMAKRFFVRKGYEH